ncbi:MAG: exosortase-associated EpsI family protein [Immundisolibacteraceae bacterium]|nr:exosortase-associated EpsI family protein [Immundisolibacteraceae bacterium]
MRKGALVIMMLVAIVGSRPLVNAVFSDRSWVPIGEPPDFAGFQIIDRLPPPFMPNYPGAVRTWSFQKKASKTVYLTVVFYQQESQGQELVGYENSALPKEGWRHQSVKTLLVEGPGDGHEFSGRVYRKPGQPGVTIFSQYRFADYSESSRALVAKLLSLRDALYRANASAQINVVLVGEPIAETYIEELLGGVAPKLFPAIDQQIQKGSTRF